MQIAFPCGVGYLSSTMLPSPSNPSQPPERFQRSRQIRGLLLLALAAIVFAILRAGVPNVFSRGWWRLW